MMQTLGMPFGGFGFLGGIWMLLFWGVVIALVVWIVRKLASPDQRVPGQTSLDIARTRYARGEITRTEFEEIKRNLG